MSGQRLAGMAAVFLIGCAGSPIGGKYGLGNNAAGYAAEADARQARRNELARQRAEFNHYCMTRVERPPALYQWCVMRQYELGRQEDRTERQEEREDQAERDFQQRRQESWRDINRQSQPVNCTTVMIGDIAHTNCY